MQDPLFWLVLSIFFVAFSLIAILIAAFPALQELGRVARSAEKLLDMFQRELPHTLDSLRRTGSEIADFTEELEDSIKSAKGILQHTEKSLQQTQQKIRQVEKGSRSAWRGVAAAWHTWQRSTQKRKRK